MKFHSEEKKNLNYNLITILGPTATGKTKLAARLANHFNGEIISADSRQVYKKMNIGTGKDIQDYFVDGKFIEHHLIDIIEPKEEYNLFSFIKDFNEAFSKIKTSGKISFLVGGTGLYIHSILKNYELKEMELDDYFDYDSYNLIELKNILLSLTQNIHNTTDLLERDRIIKAILIEKSNLKKTLKANLINSLTIGIKLDRAEIKNKITLRLKKRLQEGMIEEVESLLEDGITFERLKLFGLEYKFIAMHLNNELNYNDMFQKLNSAIHNFAKRQMTWFRKMEKEGVNINWIDGADYVSAKNLIQKHFNLK